MAENTTDLKVEIKGLKKDIESSNRLNERLDTAIEKLTDVSTSIKSMLAVHEEKISRQEQIDEIIFDKLKARQDEITHIQKDLTASIELSEKRLLCEIKTIRNDIGDRVSMLEKWKWLILGGSVVVGWILSKNFTYIVSMLS